MLTRIIPSPYISVERGLYGPAYIYKKRQESIKLNEDPRATEKQREKAKDEYEEAKRKWNERQRDE